MLRVHEVGRPEQDEAAVERVGVESLSKSVMPCCVAVRAGSTRRGAPVSIATSPLAGREYPSLAFEHVDDLLVRDPVRAPSTTLRTADVASAADASCTDVARMLAASVGANCFARLRQSAAPQARGDVDAGSYSAVDDGLGQGVANVGIVEHRPDRTDVGVGVQHECAQPRARAPTRA